VTREEPKMEKVKSKRELILDIAESGILSGLRTMFFLLLNIVDKFHYFKIGLSVILVYVGVKMLAHGWLHSFIFETTGSLITIVSILVISMVASLLFPKKVVHK
jgi:tellurite resistance protein TerC